MQQCLPCNSAEFMLSSVTELDIPHRTSRIVQSMVEKADHEPWPSSTQNWVGQEVLCYPGVAPVLPSSLVVLDVLRRHSLDGLSVLDFGTGTGVLTV